METLETQFIILIYGLEWPFTSSSRGALVYFPFYFDCPKGNGSWEASCSKICRWYLRKGKISLEVESYHGQWYIYSAKINKVRWILRNSGIILESILSFLFSKEKKTTEWWEYSLSRTISDNVNPNEVAIWFDQLVCLLINLRHGQQGKIAEAPCLLLTHHQIRKLLNLFRTDWKKGVDNFIWGFALTPLQP